jgi:hypothetical protein
MNEEEAVAHARYEMLNRYIESGKYRVCFVKPSMLKIKCGIFTSLLPTRSVFSHSWGNLEKLNWCSTNMPKVALTIPIGDLRPTVHCKKGINAVR